LAETDMLLRAVWENDRESMPLMNSRCNCPDLGVATKGADQMSVPAITHVPFYVNRNPGIGFA
jgi:hypothetical protein